MLPLGRYRCSPERAFGDAVIVAFLVAQVLDGAFTYVGVHTFGRAIEGNPIIAWLIHLLGPGPALAASKGLAVVFGAFLHLIGVHTIVAVLTAVYFVAAVGPWFVLLLLHA